MKQITLDRTKNSIFNAILEAADKLGWDILDKSLYYGTVSLEHTGGLLSFGNFIDVKIKPISGAKFTIYVSSRSSAKIQLVDWGTNSSLESELIESLEEILD